MTRIPRRTFLGATAAATAATLVSTRSFAAEDSTTPEIKLGLIGCGWWGLIDARAALKAGGVQIAALCDVDAEHLSKAADEMEKLQGTRPVTFKHYEELLDTEGLHGVIIATPTHWHALPFIAACGKGLAIYCEKPLAYDILEGKAMEDAARESGNIVQIGFQRRHAAGFVEAAEYIRQGNAGRIISAEAQIHYRAVTPDPTPVDPPPSLDWDLWCGPAPLIPHSKSVGHMSWRLEETTGHGHLVDWGIHLIDTARWMLGLGAPKAVTSAGGLHHLKGKITTPDILTAHFEFETCPLTWRHRIWGARDMHQETSNGIFLYGEKETVFCTDNKWIVRPNDRDGKEEVHETTSDPGQLHMTEFIEAVRSKKQVSCSVSEGHLSTTAVKLAMISHETGSKVLWDAQTGAITGNEAASLRMKRDYRAPWTHPHQG